jgi:hypothetical protein
MQCSTCFTEFIRTGGNQKYCPSCSKQRRKTWLRTAQQTLRNNRDAVAKVQLRIQIRLWERMYKRTHPEVRLVHSLRNRLVKVLHGVGKSASTVALLGCSRQELKQHLEKQFQDGMTWDNYGAWHIDHRLPCASFDLSDQAQQKICFHYTNLQPLWAKDNLRKGARVQETALEAPPLA